jgi:hypothetical protein
MGKGAAILGLILIIIGILPILLPMINLAEYVAYFPTFGLIEPIAFGGFEFTDFMLILIGVGIILLIIGAVT